MTGGYAFDDRRYRGFFASTDGFTDGTGFESVIAQEFWPRMSVAHEVFAVVPDAWITEDTESVSFRGAGNVFLQGSATVTATEAAFVDGPYPCGEGEVSFRVQEGSFVGSAGRPLTADFVTGPLSAPVTPDAWYGYIVRTVVAS